jgi:hypothetical protein
VWEAFLAYLRDQEVDNVKWKPEEEKLYFEFYQGSNG